MKSIFLFLFVGCVLSSQAQTVRWDCSAIRQALQANPSQGVFLGFYHVSYSYEHPYTQRTVEHFATFTNPDSARLEINLPIPSEVRVTFMGLGSAIGTELWLTPGEEVTIAIKDAGMSGEFYKIPFSTFKNQIEFRGTNGKMHQAYSFLKSQFMVDYGKSLFDVGTISDNYEIQQWSYDESPDSIISFYNSHIQKDFGHLKQFVKENQLSTDFEITFQQHLVSAWLEQASSHVPDKSETKTALQRYFLDNYTKQLFQKPFSPAYISYATTLLSLTDPENLSYAPSFPGMLKELDKLLPKENWPNIYAECSQYNNYQGFYHAEEIFAKYPEESVKVSPLVKQATRVSNDRTLAMLYIDQLKTMDVPTDYKLTYLGSHLQFHRFGRVGSEVESLDSAFLKIGSYSTGKATNEAVKATYLSDEKAFFQLPTYANNNTYLPMLTENTQMDSIVKSYKGKPVVLFMLGHNAEDSRRCITASTIQLLQQQYGDRVVFVALTVDRLRKDAPEHALKFAQTFREYGVTNAYVVAGSNSFWLDVYESRGCVVRIYKPDGTQLPLGTLQHSYPKTPIATLIKSALQ